MLMWAWDGVSSVSVWFILTRHMYVKMMHSLEMLEKGVLSIFSHLTLNPTPKSWTQNIKRGTNAQCWPLDNKKCRSKRVEWKLVSLLMVMSDSGLDLADISASRYHMWSIRCEVATYQLAALSRMSRWGISRVNCPRRVQHWCSLHLN